MMDDPSITKKVVLKSDRATDAHEYIDEIRQTQQNDKERIYRLWKLYQAMYVDLLDWKDRLGDTGLNQRIDDQLVNKVETTAKKYVKRLLYATITAIGGLIALGVEWLVKMALKGMHSP